MDLLASTTRKTEKTMDNNSPEFLQARAERIEKRRKRIAAKMAKEKGALEVDDALSTQSSLQFLTTSGRDGGSTSRVAPKNKRSGSPVSSQSQRNKSDGHNQIRKSAEGGGAATTNVEYNDDGALDTEMMESRKQLEQIILDGETLITNVKVAAEYRERARELRVEESKKERLKRLEQESKESQQMYETINENWLANAEKLLPMELYEKIQEQQKACDNLLEKQDEEIYDLRKELEDNDLEYENLLEMYQKDIMLMGDRIDDNIDTLRSAFMEELDLIEHYTVKDREQLLENNQKEWMNLLKEYEDLEKKSLENRKNDALTKFERLTDLYGNVKQEARLLKNQMQNDMRTLFCEREKIKCAIQINLEKLDYNLAVLRKREEENMKMKNSMKRLLLKLQDRFNEKSKTLRDKVVRGKKESAKLIKDIRRLESLCDDAKRKTLHIYASDFHNFIDLWQLNEEECREKIFRLLGSERFIIEEQLGTHFVEPDMSRLNERPPEVQCYLNKMKCACGPLLPPPPTRGSLDKMKSTKSGKLSSAKPSTVMTTVSFLDSTPSEGGGDKKSVAVSRTSLYVDPCEFFDVPTTIQTDLIQRRLMKHITNVVSDQTGFLLEEKLRKIMIPMVDSERQLIHIDTVLQALGVRHIDEMQILARYLLKYSSIMKGIISKPSLPEPDLNEMKISESGLPIRSKSLYPDPQSCDDKLLTDMAYDKIDEIKEQMRLTPSTLSEDTKDQEPIPPSAMKILSDMTFDNVRGIREVRALPSSDTLILAQQANMIGGAGGEKTGQNYTSAESQAESKAESTPSVLQIIEEFSSDESLAHVLKQVEKHARKKTAKGGGGGGSGQETRKAAAAESSSSCSCDSYIGAESRMDDDGDSTSQGGDILSQPEEDPFNSNKATVFSWVTEVAAGLTSDCQRPPGVPPHGPEYRGEEDGSMMMYVEEIGEDGGGGGGVHGVGRVTGDSDNGPPSIPRTPDEFTEEDDEEEEPPQEFKKQTTPVRSSCGPSDASGMSLASRSSGLDSTEFFYIEPNDVLRALAAFCRDHNAKTKSELPTKSEVYESRMKKICFPSKPTIKEYWDKFTVLLDPKSKQLWDGIQDVFLEYDENLRIRNKFVEDVVKYYRQNYELSHLLKKHVMDSQKSLGPPPHITVGPFDPADLPFCDYPGSEPQLPSSSSSKYKSKFVPCPPSQKLQKQPQQQHRRPSTPGIRSQIPVIVEGGGDHVEE